nr:putative reverse transcriptase, RNA-dependent DNA polymerase [Tanacetum cinerariifolium]
MKRLRDTRPYSSLKGAHREKEWTIAKLVIVRILLAVATKKGWIIHQLDVNKTFLHRDLDEEVYMKIPKGLQKKERLEYVAFENLFTGLSKHQETDPQQNHLEAAKRVLRYLKGTPGQRILLPRKGPTTLIAYYDSNWLGCPFTRRSRTGYLLLLVAVPSLEKRRSSQSFLGLRQRQNIER